MISVKPDLQDFVASGDAYVKFYCGALSIGENAGPGPHCRCYRAMRCRKSAHPE